ncbi:MAG: peptidylprolyl isomerase [Polyangiaceae bacterium]|nr:peptidylprolyl isomerase [Polyangiaceae bacterium]
MAKKTDEKSSTKHDKDLDRKKAAEEEEVDEEEDEEEDEEDEEEDEEDEEDDDAVPAKAEDRRHRAHAHDEDDDDDEAEAPAAEEDPTWWAPHAVLGLLVFVGILGFFGVFNKALGFLAATPGGVKSEAPASQPATPTQQQAKPSQPQPMQQQQPQPPREMFGAKHLLVMYKGSRRAPANIERSKEEAKARAEEAAKKAKDPKNKFEDLVKEYSDEPGAGARGGDLGRFPKGAMVPEFQNALEKLKPNEVSGIVETPFGFHVILRTQ